MVNAVAFRALDEIAEPVRRLHVPVIEELGNSRHHDGDRRALRIQPEQQVENR
jgi:hypothetical protein